MATASNSQSEIFGKKYDTTRVVQMMILLLVGGAFYLGNLSAKVNYLEKNQGTAANSNGTQVAGTNNNPPPAAAPPTEISQETFKQIVDAGRHVMGNKNAPVTIVEFSDFQCPFCKRFYDDSLVQMRKDYIDTGKVKLVFMQFPLSQIHPDAMNAAIASECAAEQGKFEAYHDMLFANQLALSKDSLKQYAANLKLNTSKFNSCLDEGRYKDLIDKETALGQTNGINGTPGFFVNGKLISGAMPYENFKTMIEEALKS